MRTYKIYLIRHGLTSANFEGKYIGLTDIDLCEEGVSEILSLKKEYEYPNVGRVYTSPLRRAIQTARLIYPEMQPITVDDLREYSFGEFEDKTMEELENDPKYKSWLESAQEICPQGAEKMSDFKNRVVEGLDRVIKDMMRDKITHAAVVTHAGVIMTMLSLCGLPKRPPLEWAVDSGKGYTLLINTSLWANNNIAEVFTPIPYGTNKDKVMLDYQKQFDDDNDTEYDDSEE